MKNYETDDSLVYETGHGENDERNGEIMRADTMKRESQKTNDEGQISDESKSRCTVLKEKYRDKSVYKPQTTGARTKHEM